MTSKKYTKIQNARAGPLFCSLNLLLGGVISWRRLRVWLGLPIAVFSFTNKTAQPLSNGRETKTNTKTNDID